MCVPIVENEHRKTRWTDSPRPREGGRVEVNGVRDGRMSTPADGGFGLETASNWAMLLFVFYHVYVAWRANVSIQDRRASADAEALAEMAVSEWKVLTTLGIRHRQTSGLC